MRTAILRSYIGNFETKLSEQVARAHIIIEHFYLCLLIAQTYRPDFEPLPQVLNDCQSANEMLAVLVLPEGSPYQLYHHFLLLELIEFAVEAMHQLLRHKPTDLSPVLNAQRDALYHLKEAFAGVWESLADTCHTVRHPLTAISNTFTGLACVAKHPVTALSALATSFWHRPIRTVAAVGTNLAIGSFVASGLGMLHVTRFANMSASRLSSAAKHLEGKTTELAKIVVEHATKKGSAETHSVDSIGEAKEFFLPVDQQSAWLIDLINQSFAKSTAKIAKYEVYLALNWEVFLLTFLRKAAKEEFCVALFDAVAFAWQELMEVMLSAVSSSQCDAAESSQKGFIAALPNCRYG